MLRKENIFRDSVKMILTENIYHIERYDIRKINYNFENIIFEVLCNLFLGYS